MSKEDPTNGRKKPDTCNSAVGKNQGKGFNQGLTEWPDSIKQPQEKGQMLWWFERTP